MKRLFPALALTLLHFAASHAYADDSSKTAKVEEYMRLVKMDEMLRQTLEMSANQMKSGMLQEMMGVQLPPEQQKQLDEFVEQMQHRIFEIVAWDKLKPDYLKLMVETYTDAELDDIIAFYKSPSGKSLIAKNPV